jgi:NAD(P)-dependent dehydrogenase (short-subunit alcohol dehydrogenase family)
VAGPLDGKVALVAGATRGAGRGIAIALGEAGATVYGTGRSTRERRSEYERPETIEETAELVTEAGGTGVAVAVDHLEPAQVRSSSGSTPSRDDSTSSSTTSGAARSSSASTRRSGSTRSTTRCGCSGSASTRT